VRRRRGEGEEWDGEGWERVEAEEGVVDAEDEAAEGKDGAGEAAAEKSSLRRGGGGSAGWVPQASGVAGRVAAF
jgi:hypothetical protein